MGIDQNDILMVTDCITAHVLEVTRAKPNNGTSGTFNISHGSGGAGGGEGNNPQNWNQVDQDYDNTTPKAMRSHAYTYYVAENPQGGSALYRRDDMRASSHMGTVELVDNVDAMRIAYGDDSTGDMYVDRYRPAGQLSDSDWENVGSVRISLLLRSDEVLSEEHTTTFDLLGQDTFSQTDRRVRLQATTTIALRNRVP